MIIQVVLSKKLSFKRLTWQKRRKNIYRERYNQAKNVIKDVFTNCCQSFKQEKLSWKMLIYLKGP